MSDNKNEPELSGLISSAMEKKKASMKEDTAPDAEEVKALPEQPPKAKKEGPPDISFKDSAIKPVSLENGKPAEHSKPADASKVHGDAANRPARQTAKQKAPQRSGTNRNTNTANERSKRSVGAKTAQPNKKQPSNQKSAANRSDTHNANRTANKAVKRAEDKSAKRPAPAAKKSRPKPEGSSESAAAAVRKTPFSKKQVATISGLILALLLVLLLILYIIFSYYFNLLDKSKENISNSTPMTYSDVDLSKPDTLNRQEEDERLKELLAEGEKITNKDVINLMLIGEDLRDTESGDAGNTDVMMIISVNTKDKTITLTSIMRDCYVTFQDANGWWYSSRINSAYWHGGVDLTQQTIENYLNVKIDRYVLVNFKTFIDIVDTIGGLDLDVTDEEANGYPGADPYGDNTRGMQNPLDEQNKYLGNKKGTDYIKKGGHLHLNGNQALAYARLRHVGNSDYDRTRRQRTVISEIIKKTRGLSLTEINDLALKILPQLKTDITKKEALRLIADLLDYRNYELQEFRVPADGTFTEPTIDGMDVLSVDYETNAQMFRELVYGSVEVDAQGNETDKTIE